METGQNPSDGSPHEKAAKQRVKGTVVMNALVLNRARVERGLTQEALAEKTGVNPRTLQRAEAGLPVERETAGWIAGALGVPLLMLLKDALPVPPSQGGPPPKGKETVEIVVNIDRSKCGPDEIPRLVSKAVAEFSNNALVKGGVFLVKVVLGSIRIILEVDKDDAERLLEAFQKGELAYLDVAAVTLPSRPQKGRDYFVVIGLLGLACGLAALIPAIRFPASALGLALGVAGAALSFRRKAGLIVAALAALLNAAVLGYALYGALDKPAAAGDATHPDGGSERSKGLTSRRGETRKETGRGADTFKVGTQKEPPIGPKHPKEEEIKEAIKKGKDAELSYNGAPVEISDVTITSLITWGDASHLTPENFKTGANPVLPGVTGLPAEVHCGTSTGYMGNSGGFSIFASLAVGSDLAIKERKERLVVFVPYDAKGFGRPVVVKGVDNGTGYDYKVTAKTNRSGYYLVK